MIEYSICKVMNAANIKPEASGWIRELPPVIFGTNCLRKSQGKLSVNYTANHTFEHWGIEITKEGHGKWAHPALLRDYEK